MELVVADKVGVHLIYCIEVSFWIFVADMKVGNMRVVEWERKRVIFIFFT